MSGNLTVRAGANSTLVVDNNTRMIGLQVGSTINRGIWDFTRDRWMLYNDDSKYIKSTAGLIFEQAQKDEQGNVIHNTYIKNKLKDVGSSGYGTASVIPQIGGDGVMEIGRIIDFHNADKTGKDYCARIELSNEKGGLNIYGASISDGNLSRIKVNNIQPLIGGTLTIKADTIVLDGNIVYK